MTYYFPFMDDSGFILLIPPILVAVWLITTSTPWKRRKLLWRKLKQLMSPEDQP